MLSSSGSLMVVKDTMMLCLGGLSTFQLVSSLYLKFSCGFNGLQYSSTYPRQM